MWYAVNLPHHMLLDNPAKAAAEHLNKIGATFFVTLREDSAGDVSGVAWVPGIEPEEEQ